MLRELNYSRTLEKEADDKGMELMVQNHLSPAGMKALMITLQEKASEEGEGFAFLSTHPLTKKRIRNADKFIKKHKSDVYQSRPGLTSLWQQMQEREE